MEAGRRTIWQAVAGLIVYAAVVAAAFVSALGPVPDEQVLARATGPLEHLRVVRHAKTGETTFELTISTAERPVDVHIGTFGRPQVEGNLLAIAARRAVVTVRYRQLPLGNRGFAIAEEHRDIIALADARRFLEAQDLARGNERWGALVLYGAVPPLVLLVVWWRRRHAPRPAAGLEPHRDAVRVSLELATQRMIALVLMPVVLVLIALAGVPDAFVRVMGAVPLGMPPMLTYLGLCALALAPLAAAMWFVAGLMQALRRVDGKIPIGKWAVLLGVLGNRADPDVRANGLKALAAFAVFALLAASWIVAAG